jgi:hypothetical protein
MGEILAVGLTHYPPLAGEDARMSGLLKMMLRNPDLPEPLRDPANWPEAMRTEWADDDGTAAASHHRAQLLAWLRRVRAALDEFDPDFILIWGDDQYENFKEDIIPPFCVNAHDQFEFNAPPNNVWNEPADRLFTVPGAARAGRMLASELIWAGVDVSYSYKPLHHNLGHAFTNAIFYLDYDRRGFSWPILPVSVNCYGRHVISQRGGLPQFDRPPLTPEDLDPPAPTPKRLFEMGRQTARILTESPYRVALLASSGWSHAFLTEKHHYLYPDTPADKLLYDALISGNYEAWRNYPASAVEESGQQEILNWMCLAGALNELKRTPQEAGFVDTWIFNSSKSFLIARP